MRYISHYTTKKHLGQAQAFFQKGKLDQAQAKNENRRGGLHQGQANPTPRTPLPPPSRGAGGGSDKSRRLGSSVQARAQNERHETKGGGTEYSPKARENPAAP